MTSSRNFLEERRRQLIGYELQKTIDRVFCPPEVIELYRQNPLLNVLLRNVTSPYTRPVPCRSSEHTRVLSAITSSR